MVTTTSESILLLLTKTLIQKTLIKNFKKLRAGFIETEFLTGVMVSGIKKMSSTLSQRVWLHLQGAAIEVFCNSSVYKGVGRGLVKYVGPTTNISLTEESAA